MATNEELETRIAEIEGMVVSEYDPPSGPEYSYPIPGEPMSDDMWSHLAKAWGSGVISYGGAPYRLGNVDDINNTLTVYKADDEGRESGAVLEGYAHRMTEDVTLKVPAVSEETDYVIGLKFDPLNDGRPITLGVFTRPLNTTQGKKYIPIWEGRRNPSTVLSTVEWQTARSRISPTTTVAREKYLPDPRHSGLMWGTICYTYRDQKWFQLQWATEDEGEMVWVDITDPKWSDWVFVPDGTYVNPGSGFFRGQRSKGDTVELRGRVARADGSKFVAGGGGASGGYTLMYLEPGNYPGASQRFIAASDGYSSNSLCVITVSPDGVVYGTPLMSDATWIGLDGIRFYK